MHGSYAFESRAIVGHTPPLDPATVARSAACVSPCYTCYYRYTYLSQV